MKVLIVDDNEQGRQILCYNFNWHGYRILEAANGQEALELAIVERPDLIISDVLMPKMDGFQLLREVKKLPELSGIPFIFYSSVYVGTREKELALALGARAFIVKPLSPEAFWDEITRLQQESVPPRVPTAHLSSSDEEYIREYSQIVTAKLEEKIRELEAANQRIGKSESRYRNLFASMRDVVVIADLSRIIIDANQPALQTIFGYATEEVLGKSTALIYADPVQFELAGKEVFNRQDVEAGKLLELQFRRKSGEVFDGEIYALKMRDDNEQLVGNLGIIRDISERKRAALALEQSEAQFRQISQEFNGLLDAIPDSLMLLAPDLKVLWANRAVAEYTGVAAEELIGNHCYACWHKRVTPCDPCPVLQSFESGRPCNDTVTRSDEKVWDIRTVPLLDKQGLVTRVIEVKRDITEYKKLEAQYLHVQKMESIGTLASGVAHDFNNILTVIVGLGQIMFDEMATDDPNRRNLKGILDAANRATHLTRQLLLFSRKQKAERRTVDLNEVVGKIEKFLRRIIVEDITLKLELCVSSLPVLADNTQLEQVLMNLAVNARDAMPDGGEFILQSAQAVLDEEFMATHGYYGTPGAYALLSVSDTGLGVDSATVQHIFEPFFTTKEVGKGTGLGLAVVYGIIKQHEGFITVDSEPGYGTVFKIYLPLAEAAQQAIAVQQVQPMVRGTETILYAEDDALVRELMTSVLTAAGYKVIVAVNGEDAVLKFKEHPEAVQLLLLDMKMPRMNGKDAYDEICKMKPKIKALFFTGYASDTTQQLSSHSSTITLLMKPVPPKELLREVRKVLDRTG